MINLKRFPPKITIKSKIIVKAKNNKPILDDLPLYVVETSCLVIMQTVNASISLGNNIIYTIYVLNKIHDNIYNLQLEDLIPYGTKFISCYVDNGNYKYYKEKVICNIDIIKPGTFAKIIVIVRPVIWGKIVNSIELVTKDYAQYTVNNPSRVSCFAFPFDVRYLFPCYRRRFLKK